MKSENAILFREFLFKLSCILSSLYVVLCPGSPAMAASPPGDVVGKVTVGYQGWFACVGDGAPIDSWWHYSGTFAAPAFASLTIHNAALVMTVSNLTIGGTVVLQTSTNLQNWISIQTNAVNSSILTLTNPINKPAQFFRVLEH